MNAPSHPLTLGIELIDDPGWMGGTLYLKNLAICLSRLPEAERPRIRLLGSPPAIASLLAEHPDLRVEGGQGGAGLVGRVLHRLVAGRTRDTGLDVVYPGFGAPVPGAVVLRWIPDFQHRHLPQLFEGAEIEARDRSIGELAARPGLVVVSSEVARADFARFFPGHAAIARVWHFCSLLDTTDPVPEGLTRKYGLPGKYLYLPNQFWAHKNHMTVFKALARLRKAGIEIPLVCTGAESDRRNPGHLGELLSLIEHAGLASQVLRLGMIDRRDQVGVLRCAAAVVQPSLFEGWSTVVEDARAVGRPIFLSDLPVHREQAPPRCTYFEPQSDDQLANALRGQWADLAAGPDRNAEREAREIMAARILDSGRTFVDIARQALATGSLS
jgi:glycosyltransferase involved in cell wall biosynthesis